MVLSLTAKGAKFPQRSLSLAIFAVLLSRCLFYNSQFNNYPFGSLSLIFSLRPLRFFSWRTLRLNWNEAK
jgi:hypothetical protein